MTRTSLALATYRLQRAKQAFAEGELLVKGNALYGAVNRFYYAAFYAARALLATKGLDASKHRGVIALFQQHFVKTGAVDATGAKILPRSFERRLNADYEDFATVDEAAVAKVAEQVQQFMAVCEDWLKTHAAAHRT